jgi:hypothetical protein
MFSDQEVNEFVDEEFDRDIWGQVTDFSRLIDPPMEQSGPKLNEEFDIQEWQKLILLSTPMSKICDKTEPTCLRVKRVGTGLGRFYYKACYYNSWGDYDLEEMCKKSIPEPESFDIGTVKSEVEAELKIPEADSVVLENEVKTRMQITLKRQGANVRGHNGNFVVHGMAATNMIGVLSELVEAYPKIKRPAQTVRIQFTEYRVSSGDYRPERGGNMNLHNAEVNTISAFISTKLVTAGFTMRGREWVHESQATAESIIKTGSRLAEVKKIIDELPNTIDVMNAPYNKGVHCGLWCLCRIRGGHSWVLSTSRSVEDIFNEQKKIPQFTYILNPNGSMHRKGRTSV